MLSLEEKIDQTRKILSTLLTDYSPKDIFVAWTGGKDSTALLYYWKKILEKKKAISPRAINIDTGLKFPEIIEFRDNLAQNWKISLEVVRPDISLLNYPIAKDKVQCCYDLKVVPLKKGIKKLNIKVLLTGIRGDEHSSRQERKVIEERKEPFYLQVNPLLAWTELDVWTFLYRENIPYCILYEQGYRSLGCMPCTKKVVAKEERAGRDREKEEKLAYLTSLGYF